MAGGKETGFKDFNIVKPNSPATQNSPHAEIEQPTAGSSNVQQSPTGRSPEHMIDHWKSFLAVSSKEPSKNSKLQQNVSSKTQTSQLLDIPNSQYNKGEQYSYGNVGTIISLPNNTAQFQNSETSPVNIVTSRGNQILTVDPNQYVNPECQLLTAGNFQDQNTSLQKQPITFFNSSPQPESNVSSPEHRLVIAENIEQSLVPTKSVSPTKTPKSNVKWNIEKLVQNDDDMSLEKNKILMNLHNDERKQPQGILKSTPPIKEQNNRPYFYGSQKGQQISEPENRVNLMFKQPAQQHDINKSVQEQQNLQTMNYQSPSSTLGTPQNANQMQPQSQYLYSAHQPSQSRGQQPAKRDNDFPNVQVNQEQNTANNPYQQPKYTPNMPNQQLQNPPSIANQQRQYPPNTTNQLLHYQHNLANQQPQHPSDTVQYSPNTPFQQQQYSTNMANQHILYSPNTAYQQLQNAPTNTANQQLQHAPPNTANQQHQYSQNTGNQQLQYSSNMHMQQLQYSPNTGTQQLQHTSMHMAKQQPPYSPNTANQQLSNTHKQQPPYSTNTDNQHLHYTLSNTPKHQPPYSTNKADQQQLYSSNIASQQPPYSPGKVNQQLQCPQNISSQQFGYREQYPPNKANEEHVQVLQLKHESFHNNRADKQDFRQSGQKHESFYTHQPLKQDNHHQQVAKDERGQQGQNRIEIHHPNLNNQLNARQIQNQQTEVQTSSLASKRLQHTPTQNGSIYAHAALSPFTKQVRSTDETVIAENQHAGQRSTIPNAQVANEDKKEKTQSQKGKIQPKHSTKDNIQKIELDFIASPPVLFTPEYLMLKIPKQETSSVKPVSNEKNKKRGQSPVDGTESFESGPVKKLKLEEVRIRTANIDQYPESEESRRSVKINKRGFKKYLLSRYEEDKRMLAHSTTKIQCEKFSPPPNNDSVLHATSNIPLKRTYASCDLAPEDPAPDGVGNKTNEYIALSVGNKENTKISRNDINVMLDKEKNTESPKQCNEQSSVQEPILSDLGNTSTSFPTENGSEISLNQIRLDLAMSSDSSVASDTEKSSQNDVSQCSGDQCSEIADCTDSRHLLGHDDSTNARDKNNHTSIKPVTVLSTFFSQSTNQMILPSFDQGRNIGFLIDFNPRRFGIIEHEGHLEQNFNAIPAKPTFSYRMTQNQRWNNLLAVRNTALLYQKFTQTV